MGASLGASLGGSLGVALGIAKGGFWLFALGSTLGGNPGG